MQSSSSYTLKRASLSYYPFSCHPPQLSLSWGGFAYLPQKLQELQAAGHPKSLAMHELAFNRTCRLGQVRHPFSNPDESSNFNTWAFSLMVRTSVSLNPSSFVAWMSMVISSSAPVPTSRSIISRVTFPISRL